MDTTPIVIDIECCASPEAAQYLDPVKAPDNYKDPIKIAAYEVEKFAERVAKAALEPDLNEVVAVGWIREDYGEANVYTSQEHDEAVLLEMLWQVVERRSIIGYNVLGYDLPVLIRRSQLLGVKYPAVNIDRYRTPHIDLMQRLSFNGALTFRSLGFYLRRFGIPHDDKTTGADIAGMVARGDWAGVAAHCRSDILGTAALARRLGWLPQTAQAPAVL